MKVDFAFVCDYAAATGKLNAMGIGFDTIFATKVPCKHNHFSYVIQLRANVVEAGQKNLEVHLIDEDGHDVVQPLKGQVAIPKIEGTTETRATVVLEFNNVEFPRYAFYSLNATIDGLQVSEVPLRVSPPPPAPQAPPAPAP